jgi:flagellar basal-body rod protein FlgB
MDVSTTPLFSALESRLKFLSARASLIAENLANADTPDYGARDLKAPDFPRLASAAALRVTDPRHLAARGTEGSNGRIVDAPDPEASINGNRVSVETQSMKLAQTRQDYQLASTIYRKSIELLRFAARGGR